MEYIKKYWFVGLICILFTFAIVYFASSESEANFKGKQVNGEDVVFSYNGENITANQLYDEFFDQQAPSLGLNFLQIGAYTNSMETTKEMEDTAQQYYDNYISYAKYTYGEEYKDVVLKSLRTLGYDSIEGLKDYYVAMLKMDNLRSAYMDEHITEIWDEYNEANSPRLVSHILVKMADSANPTEEELAKVKSVEEALASGKDFAEVAKEFSDDGSAAQGGSLGFVHKNTNFVKEFLDAALLLNENETTAEWVVSQYGYHIIKCDACSYEALKDNTDFQDNLAEYANVDGELFKAQLSTQTVDYHGHTIIEDYVKAALGQLEEEAK